MIWTPLREGIFLYCGDCGEPMTRRICRYKGKMDMRYDDIVAFDQEIVELKAEQEKYKKLRAALYEDYKKGIISKEDFKTFSAIYEEKYSEIQSDLDKQMENLKGLFKNGLEAGVKLEQYKDILQLEALNRTALVHLVEKIYVYGDKRIHVVLRHQNHFIKVGMLYDFLKQSDAERMVDCIVVKDLSRFGRNHLEMGNYLSKIFPFLGVRFIAINDNFDNMDGDPETLSVQLKNLVNELYAKDIAVKIRSSRVKQFERGSFSGCHPVYGYDIVKEGNRRVLVVNEEAAVIVKELFARFLRGENYLEMIEWLYTSKIHRPSDYRKYGHVYQQEGEDLHNWHKATLNQILNNCAYIGYLICEQVDGERVSGRTSTKVLTGEMKVREGNHEPIISEEIFHEVARRFEKRSHKFSSGSSRKLPIEEDIFKDLLFCGLCGGKFTRECGLTNRSGGKVRNYHYRCINKDTIDGRKCNSQRISLIVLKRLVEEALEREFSLSSLKQKDLVAASNRQAESEKKKMEKEIADADYKIEQLKKTGSEDYIKFRLDELEEAVMKEKAEKRKQDIEKLQDRQEILSRMLSEMDGRTEKRKHYLRTLMKCKKGTPLTAEVLHVLIDKIEVFPDAKIFEFSDDGYSGTNFDRPGIQNLLDRVRNYEIKSRGST